MEASFRRSLVVGSVPKADEARVSTRTDHVECYG